uniref:GRIP domain-containing protein n=1 Tax=Timema bartmani TaxID=61472 RepID=A0A7R9F3V4_9NEOP|nr:unnamed protein product [Timema bartmani]
MGKSSTKSRGEWSGAGEVMVREQYLLLWAPVYLAGKEQDCYIGSLLSAREAVSLWLLGTRKVCFSPLVTHCSPACYNPPSKTLQSSMLQSPSNTLQSSMLQSPSNTLQSSMLQSPSNTLQSSMLQSPSNTLQSSMLQSPGNIVVQHVIASPLAIHYTLVMLQFPGGLIAFKYFLSPDDTFHCSMLKGERAMYRRLVESRANKGDLDPEITLQFLKSAVYYLLTDRENHQGHLNAIQSILGYTDTEKLNIDKAYKLYLK